MVKIFQWKNDVLEWFKQVKKYYIGLSKKIQISENLKALNQNIIHKTPTNFKKVYQKSFHTKNFVFILLCVNQYIDKSIGKNCHMWPHTKKCIQRTANNISKEKRTKIDL